MKVQKTILDKDTNKLEEYFGKHLLANDDFQYLLGSIGKLSYFKSDDAVSLLEYYPDAISISQFELSSNCSLFNINYAKNHATQTMAGQILQIKLNDMSVNLLFYRSQELFEAFVKKYVALNNKDFNFLMSNDEWVDIHKKSGRGFLVFNHQIKNKIEHHENESYGLRVFYAPILDFKTSSLSKLRSIINDLFASVEQEKAKAKLDSNYSFINAFSTEMQAHMSELNFALNKLVMMDKDFNLFSKYKLQISLLTKNLEEELEFLDGHFNDLYLHSESLLQSLKKL